MYAVLSSSKQNSAREKLQHVTLHFLIIYENLK